MKTVKHRLEENKSIYVLGDTHLEHPNTDLKKIQHHIDIIKQENAAWIHLGDWVDAITPLDKRYSITDKRSGVVEAFLHMEELFSPISNQCIAALRGNHESKWSRLEGDMLEVICRRWNVPYLGYCGFVVIRTEKKNYKLWLHHGAGGGRKRGAKIIRLNEWSQFVDADIYLQGHTHTYVQFTDEQVTATKKKARHYANIPGYISSYDGYDNYVEELGLPPQQTGMLQIYFDPIQIELIT